MDVRTRSKIVKKYKYCVNCLAKSHDLRACPCVDSCRICGEYHHTLLHPSVKSRLKPKSRRYHQGRSTTSATRNSAIVARPSRRSITRNFVTVARQSSVNNSSSAASSCSQRSPPPSPTGSVHF